MITILSSAPREREALTALCEQRRWSVAACDSLRAFRRHLIRSAPRVVLTRAKLVDGFCDQFLGAPLQSARTIVLIAAGTPSSVEARLVALGADCVLRDPVRTDVLSEYIAKYLSARNRQGTLRPSPPKEIPLAGLTVDILDRQLISKHRSVKLTPREIALIQLLVEAEGEVVTYDTLYHELLGRSFTGDTINMRVLLKKLSTSVQEAGVDLREWIDVIPKTGYRYGRRLKSKARAKS